VPTQIAAELPGALAPAPDYVMALAQKFTPQGTTPQREFMSSNSNLDNAFEREMRKFDEPTQAELPQADTSNFRNAEHEQLPHDLGKLPHPSPVHHYPPRPTRARVDMAAIVVQLFQPGPMLAVILFAILVWLMYWK
jgi:hypothetical protein